MIEKEKYKVIEVAKKLNVIQIAAKYNQVEAAEVLLENGLDPDSRTYTGRTALHVAAGGSSKNEDMVRLLLKYGADPLVRGSYHNTPLDVARRKRNTRIAHIMLNHINSENSDGKPDNVFSFVDPITPFLWWSYQKLANWFTPKPVEELPRIELDVPFKGRKILIVGSDLHAEYVREQAKKNNKSTDGIPSNKDEIPGQVSNRAVAETLWVNAVLKAMKESDRIAVESKLRDLTGMELYRAMREISRERQIQWMKGLAAKQMLGEREFIRFREKFHEALREWLKESRIGLDKNNPIFVIKDYGMTSTLVHQLDFILALYVMEASRLMNEGGMSVEQAAEVALAHVMEKRSLEGLAAFILTSAGIQQAGKIFWLAELGEQHALEASAKTFKIHSPGVIRTFMSLLGAIGLVPSIAMQRAVTQTGRHHDWNQSFQEGVWGMNQDLYDRNVSLCGYEMWFSGMLSADIDVNLEALQMSQMTYLSDLEKDKEQNSKNNIDVCLVKDVQKNYRWIGLPQNRDYMETFNGDYTKYGALKLKMQLEMKNLSQEFGRELGNQDPVDLIASSMILSLSGMISHRLLPVPVLSTIVMLSIAGHLEGVWANIWHQMGSEDDIREFLEDWRVHKQYKYGRASVELRQALIKQKNPLNQNFMKAYFEEELEGAYYYQYLSESQLQLRFTMLQNAWRNLYKHAVMSLRSELISRKNISKKIEALHKMLGKLGERKYQCEKVKIPEWPYIESHVQKLFCAQRMVDAMQAIILTDLTPHQEQDSYYCTDIHLQSSDTIDDAIECALYKDYQLRRNLWASGKEWESLENSFETRLPLQMVSQDLAFGKLRNSAVMMGQIDQALFTALYTFDQGEFYERLQSLVWDEKGAGNSAERMEKSGSHTLENYVRQQVSIEDGKILRVIFPENFESEKIQIKIWNQDRKGIVDRQVRIEDPAELEWKLEKSLAPGMYYISLYVIDHVENKHDFIPIKPAFNFTVEVKQ